MCGVVGLLSKQGAVKIEVVKNLLIESQIRGKHATGICWVDDEGIHSESRPQPAMQFVEGFEWSKLSTAKAVIGHTRYSTSDPLYNQPIFTENACGTVHNGVITQAAPGSWAVECMTKNDSEILHRCLSEGKDIFSYYPKASVSALHLNSEEMIVVNNSRRPLQRYEDDEAVVYASTRDIFRRAMGVDSENVWREGIFRKELIYG